MMLEDRIAELNSLLDGDDSNGGIIKENEELKDKLRLIQIKLDDKDVLVKNNEDLIKTKEDLVIKDVEQNAIIDRLNNELINAKEELVRKDNDISELSKIENQLELALIKHNSDLNMINDLNDKIMGDDGLENKLNLCREEKRKLEEQLKALANEGVNRVKDQISLTNASTDEIMKNPHNTDNIMLSFVDNIKTYDTFEQLHGGEYLTVLPNSKKITGSRPSLPTMVISKNANEQFDKSFKKIDKITNDYKHSINSSYFNGDTSTMLSRSIHRLMIFHDQCMSIFNTDPIVKILTILSYSPNEFKSLFETLYSKKITSQQDSTNKLNASSRILDFKNSVFIHINKSDNDLDNYKLLFENLQITKEMLDVSRTAYVSISEEDIGDEDYVVFSYHYIRQLYDIGYSSITADTVHENNAILDNIVIGYNNLVNTKEIFDKYDTIDKSFNTLKLQSSIKTYVKIRKDAGYQFTNPRYLYSLFEMTKINEKDSITPNWYMSVKHTSTSATLNSASLDIDKVITPDDELGTGITNNDSYKSFIYHMFGPFNNIFKSDESSMDIFKRMSHIVSGLENGSNQFVMGYGQSGAGKTTTLVRNFDKYKYESTDANDGVLFKILESTQLSKAFKTLKVNGINAYSTGVSTRHDEFVDINESELSYTYDNVNQQWMSGKYLLSTRIEDYFKRRQTTPTPNNPDSSRSHLIIIITFDEAVSLIYCDFAGYENEFDCGDSKTIIEQFGRSYNLCSDCRLRPVNEELFSKAYQVGSGMTSSLNITSQRLRLSGGNPTVNIGSSKTSRGNKVQHSETLKQPQAKASVWNSTPMIPIASSVPTPTNDADLSSLKNVLHHVKGVPMKMDSKSQMDYFIDGSKVSNAMSLGDTLLHRTGYDKYNNDSTAASSHDQIHVLNTYGFNHLSSNGKITPSIFESKKDTLLSSLRTSTTNKSTITNFISTPASSTLLDSIKDNKPPVIRTYGHEPAKYMFGIIKNSKFNFNRYYTPAATENAPARTISQIHTTIIGNEGDHDRFKSNNVDISMQDMINVVMRSVVERNSKSSKDGNTSFGDSNRFFMFLRDMKVAESRHVNQGFVNQLPHSLPEAIEYQLSFFDDIRLHSKFSETFIKNITTSSRIFDMNTHSKWSSSPFRLSNYDSSRVKLLSQNKLLRTYGDVGYLTSASKGSAAGLDFLGKVLLMPVNASFAASSVNQAMSENNSTKYVKPFITLAGYMANNTIYSFFEPGTIKATYDEYMNKLISVNNITDRVNFKEYSNNYFNEYFNQVNLTHTCAYLDSLELINLISQCINRVSEGKFINKTITEFKQDIQNQIKTNNDTKSKLVTHNPKHPACYNYYTLTNAYSRNESEHNDRKLMLKLRDIGVDFSNMEFTFLSVINVTNNNYVNNPPAIPYINVSNLKYLIQSSNTSSQNRGYAIYKESLDIWVELMKHEFYASQITKDTKVGEFLKLIELYVTMIDITSDKMMDKLKAFSGDRTKFDSMLQFIDDIEKNNYTTFIGSIRMLQEMGQLDGSSIDCTFQPRTKDTYQTFVTISGNDSKETSIVVRNPQRPTYKSNQNTSVGINSHINDLKKMTKV